MEHQDRKAIEDLFAKLETVERSAPARDGEAEAYIADKMHRQPGAPYFMAQTIVMQEMALENQAREIEALRAAQVSRQAGHGQPQGGGFLSRLLGGSQPSRAPAPQGYGQPGHGPQPGYGQPSYQGAGGAWGGARQGAPGMASGQHAMPMQGRSGGGFLAGAAQTAMGVAGGVLLGNAIGSMFAGDVAGEAAGAAEGLAADAGEAAGGLQEAAMPEDGGGFFDGGGFDEEI